jgi:ankyrin repeat protein
MRCRRFDLLRAHEEPHRPFPKEELEKKLWGTRVSNYLYEWSFLGAGARPSLAVEDGPDAGMERAAAPPRTLLIGAKTSGQPTTSHARSRDSHQAREWSTFFADVEANCAPPRSLHAAAQSDDTDRLAKLLREGRHDLDEAHAGVPPLLFAARAGATAADALLLERSADANAQAVVRLPRATARFGAMHCAAQRDDTAMIELLLDHAADLGATATRGTTALQFAVYHGCVAATELLLARGAELHAADEDGWTAVTDAYERRSYVRLAFRCACVRGDKGASLRHVAREVIAGWMELLASQLAAAVRREAQLRWQRRMGGWLLAAVASGDAHSVARLLSRGADVHARDVDGSTALHGACEEGHVAVAALLLEADADVHACTHYRDTPLHVSARHGRVGTTALLLAHHADARATNRFGSTPREWAQRGKLGAWLPTLTLLDAALALSSAAAACVGFGRPQPEPEAKAAGDAERAAKASGGQGNVQGNVQGTLV